MIDILIPTIEDDLPMLRLTIESVKRNIQDDVNKIFIICPENENIKDFCKNNKCEYINEKEYIGFTKNVFNFGWRNGWFYQQLLKLNGDTLVECDNFLVLDSDHVLLKPHLFVDGDKFNFYTSNEHHIPYFITMDKLFNGRIQKIIDKSFISDKMIFNREMLSKMKLDIEKNCNTNWITAIANNCFNSGECGFSEFETYGTYFFTLNRDNANLIDDERLMCFEKRIERMTLDELSKEFNNYKSITEFRYAT